MPGTGTNTYLVGEKRLAVIDPGPMIEEHIRSLLTIAGNRIAWILITHAHPDHSPAAETVRARTGAPVLAYTPAANRGRSRRYTPDRALAHGERLAGEGFTLQAIHTPGHASDHLCFLLEDEKMLFTGDQIMNGSTVVIAPPDGDMIAYLDSLEELRSYPMAKLAPGHGDTMDDPLSVIDDLIQHRLNREEKVILALRRFGPATVESLVPPVYDDVPDFLHPIARFSLLAHLIKLERECLTAQAESRWRWTGGNDDRRDRPVL